MAHVGGSGLGRGDVGVCRFVGGGGAGGLMEGVFWVGVVGRHG